MLFYDRDGAPITSEQWSALLADEEYVRVASDDILTAGGQALWVSTVWLGIDHGFGHTAQPLIFETMVFENGTADSFCERYATLEAAKTGHQALVQMLAIGMVKVGSAADPDDEGGL